MKKTVFFFSCYLLCVAAFAQTSSPRHSIIPEPVKIAHNQGTFTLPENIVIEAPNLPALATTITLLKDRLTIPTGYKASVTTNAATAPIRLVINKTANAEIGKEGYQLTVGKDAVVISANEPGGLYYGVQSLLQLLPSEIESKAVATGVKWEIPAVEVTDYPRFGWRGLMFDVSRHFFTKQEVKDFIDNMARYKFNLLHWHLTDDEGWRIEIKSLPNLTKKGAWRTDKSGYFGTFSAPLPNEPLNYGGFYTQDDIKEVVQYAKERFVNILPEVDVPGHSLAAIVSYPELACTPGAENYRVRSGEKIMDWHGNGTFTALVDNSLCPASEKVYTFLDKVFTEVAALFPFEYIHVGGDECAKNFWEKSADVKTLMKKEGLKDMHEVQGYFEKRVGKIISSKGKKLIGWDEILEGGVAADAAVMSWRGEKGGIEAAKLKHEVVMSPTTFVYLDYMQGDPILEPRVYATLRLNKAYQFDPVPAGVDPKYIKGGQGNIWTEQIPNVRHLEYMIWPRAFAVSESVWSPREKKNWKNFTQKVEQQFKRYDVLEMKYATSMFEPIFTPKNKAGKLEIELATEVDDIDIYYSFDNSFPDRFYPKYNKPMEAPKDAVMLRVVTYRGKEQLGRVISMPVEELKKRAKIS
ncbi:MAG: family 20 glycosylhydrolase [Ferruginibacter sp.]|nr:family 20 glycosylhydrolase [Ferruginibacter sp.]